MASIDDLFRGFQADLGPLPADSRRRILTQVTTGARTRTTTGRSGRLVTVVASLAGIAAITTAAVTLRHLDDSSAVPADTPRVSWGQVATVQVVPDVGVSMQVAMDRAAAAIRDRAIARDVPGLQTEQSGSDTLRITVPGSVDRYGLRSLVAVSPIAVYDRTAKRLGTYRTPAEMKRGMSTLKPSQGFLIVPSPFSDATNAQWVPSRHEADQRLRSLNGAGAGGPRWEEIATPAGYRLIASAHPDRLDVVADEPLLTGADIQKVSVVNDTDTLVAGVSESTRKRLRAASKHGELVATFTVTGPYSTVLGRLTVPTGGRPEILIETPKGTASDWAHALAPAPVPAELTLVDATPYGGQPMLEGDPVTTLPEAIDRMRREQLDLNADTPKPLQIPIGSVRRVLTTVHDGHGVSVYAARTPDGDDAVYGDLGIGEGNLCTPPMGPPSLMSCTFTFSSSNQGTIIGRIGDPEITRVTVQTPSGSHTAVVQNGWYLAFVAKTDVAPRSSRSVKVVGTNEKGDLVATLDLPEGRITRAASAPTTTDAGDPSGDPGAGTPVRGFDGSNIRDANGREVRLTRDQMFGPNAVDIYDLQVEDAKRRGLEHLIPPRPETRTQALTP